MKNKDKLLWLTIGLLTLVIIGLSIFTFNLYGKKCKTVSENLDKQPIILDLVHTKKNRTIIRELPKSSSETIDYLDSEQKAELLWISGDWASVRYLGKLGFVEANNIELVNVKKYITSVNLPFRTAPNEGKVTSIIEKGSVVEVIDEVGEWRKINFNNKVGYVTSKYLEEYSKYDILEDLK